MNAGNYLLAAVITAFSVIFPMVGMLPRFAWPGMRQLIMG